MESSKIATDGDAYRFSTSVGTFNKYDTSYEESLRMEIRKIYQIVVPGIGEEVVNNYIEVMERFSLEHKNLEILALAFFIVMNVKNNNQELTPQIFQQYFNQYGNTLIKNVTNEKPNEINDIRIKYQITLYRYVRFVKMYI